MSSSSFEKILDKEGQLIYSNVGDSMLPLIRQGRDLLVIRRQTGRLKKYDVPLYRRDSGQYVLHRVLKVRDNDYVICGDNRWHRETGITDRHILGVLTAIIRDGKEVPVTKGRIQRNHRFRGRGFQRRTASPFGTRLSGESLVCYTFMKQTEYGNDECPVVARFISVFFCAKGCSRRGKSLSKEKVQAK